MTKRDLPKGILNDNYASNREKKKELYFRYRVRAEVVRRSVAELFPGQKGLRLADLGAADGKTLEYMCSILPVSCGVGFEYNPELMSRASDALQASASMQLRQGDVTDLADVGEGEFDLVTALALLEHIGDPSRVVAEACRILRPGGLFVASSPVPFWDHVAVRTGLLKEDHHECDMHPRFFRGLVEQDAGMELLKYQRFMFAPIGLLPYFGIQLLPQRALGFDRFVGSLRLLDWLFVNQFVVARKMG